MHLPYEYFVYSCEIVNYMYNVLYPMPSARH